MILIDQSVELLQLTEAPEKLIEKAGRTCYKSEDKITDESAEKFCNMLIKRGHHSVIEHAVATMVFITNRGVTHELVRHRIASFSQESTRYVRYGGSMEFIKPVWWPSVSEDSQKAFKDSLGHAEYYYKELLDQKWRPEQAREVLPNSLKTEIVVTANLREWRHILALRTSPAAHPQIIELMKMAKDILSEKIPVFF